MCQQDNGFRIRHESKSQPKDEDEDLFSLFEFSREKQDEHSVAYQRTIFAHCQRRYPNAGNTRRHSLLLRYERPLPASDCNEQDMFSMFSWSQAKQDDVRIEEARTSFNESQIRFAKKRQAPSAITGWFAIEEHAFHIIPAVPPQLNSSKASSMFFALDSSDTEENSRTSFYHNFISNRHSVGSLAEAAWRSK